MSLKIKLLEDLKESQKKKEGAKVDTLRLFLSCVQNYEIEKRGRGEGGELSSEEVEQVLKKEIKKRKEAILLYRKGEREDLAKKEEEELRILEAYAPPEMERGEIEKLVEKAIEIIRPESPKDFGKVMSEVMKMAEGRADGKLVSELLKEKLK
ncbi:hypothetical protein A3A21_02015 [Candidatus Jorgensenbacteria bacterium RIFCSPLOWO2_01_FULL_45_25b]|uniref:Glutamyl-tRNA amidotransferase n=1 Tax=Candidatus Jorgensenbacteria bacterium RIFCSPLOWO2_01_FULL_45_25b TaxID=1798471 RepID=A0A1F6BZ03_9BACT|nr:MAG: hypothetical protein A3A21_02015 [Candidatus Jorgensenbacteria bacterium RIFCSPLOWO2_01_FULL_45_25b]